MVVSFSNLPLWFLAVLVVVGIIAAVAINNRLFDWSRSNHPSMFRPKILLAMFGVGLVIVALSDCGSIHPPRCGKASSGHTQSYFQNQMPNPAIRPESRSSAHNPDKNILRIENKSCTVLSLPVVT